jgi:streptogramin lyase
MRANRKGVFVLILPLIILISLFTSCDNKSISNDADQKNTTSAEAFIDSSSWLKPSKGIRGIFEDSKGNLWFSSTDFLCMFDGSKFTYFIEEDGLCGIGRVQEDYNGIIWIESGFQVCSYDPSAEQGKQFSSQPLKPDTTGNKWGASADDMWFMKGMERFGNTKGPPGVYRYHDGKIDFLAYPVPETDNNDNKYYPTTGAIQGKDGMVWFGTMEVIIGFKDGSFTLIDREKMDRMDDAVPVGIRGLCADSKGNLWMADNGSGVFMYNGDTTINFTKLHHLDKGDTDGNTLHRAFSIAEDDAGNMWFGTVYSGIWRFDGESLTNYSEKEEVISDNIWTIYKTKKGELLFAGENPGAVYKFNGSSFDRVF